VPGKSSTLPGTVAIAYAKTNYRTVVADDQVFQPVAGVSASDSFTISVTKAA
jgi:hypothetical protein